jgi:aminoglycoside phosphotransferase (APT) family kinase protein
MQYLKQIVCKVFSLGDPVSAPQAVTGGLLHHMWRLETTQGTFAVKELNREIIDRPGARKNYVLSEQITAAFQAKNLPVVAALHYADGPLVQIDGTTLMVFPWIEGKVLSVSEAKSEYALQIGALLGRMHHLNLHLPQLPQPDSEFISLAQWAPLINRAQERQLSCVRDLKEALPHLLEWSSLYNQSAEALQRTLVVSHRDLDQKNVLWQDEHTPWLIDWEAAGSINPTFEAVSTAFSWSGLALGEVSQETFIVFLQSYRNAGGLLQIAGLDALHGCLGNWLNWLTYSIRRALGDVTSEPEEQMLGLHETISTLAILRLLSKHKDVWATVVDGNR